MQVIYHYSSHVWSKCRFKICFSLMFCRPANRQKLRTRTKINCIIYVCCTSDIPEKQNIFFIQQTVALDSKNTFNAIILPIWVKVH